MTQRRLTYFTADVHLGIDFKDPDGRERRFVDFLRGIDPAETDALYLLGDIFDFWYEYRDVVPKGFSRVFAALIDLMDAGVKVYFFNGNHDIWTYHYLQQLGITVLRQPCVKRISGKTFCLGHGDGLGPGRRGYKFMRSVFRCRFLQILFSMLHPWIAFRLGTGWSRHRRVRYKTPYVFRGTEEPLYIFCADLASRQDIDYFVFGHFHCHVDMAVAPCPSSRRKTSSETPSASGPSSQAPSSADPSSQTPPPEFPATKVGPSAAPSSGIGSAAAILSKSPSRLLVLKDWFDSSNYIIFDGEKCRYTDFK